MPESQTRPTRPARAGRLAAPLRRAWRCIALGALLSPMASALAQSPSPGGAAVGAETRQFLSDRATAGRPWVIGLGGQLDQESSNSLRATFNWGAAERTWLSFSAGRSRSPGDRADVAADTLSAGVDHRFGLLGVVFEAEQWGDAEALESRDVRGAVYLQRERWRIALEYEHRAIDIPFTVAGPLGRTVERTAALSADGLGLTARLQPARRWQLFFSAREYDYTRDLALLPRIDRLNLLSASTLTLANSFIDHERMLGFEREIGNSLVNFSVTRDRSAVDGSEFRGLDAGFLFPISKRMDLELNLGRGDSDLFDSGVYGGVLLLIYGR
jgi:hypothetical protein